MQVRELMRHVVRSKRGHFYRTVAGGLMSAEGELSKQSLEGILATVEVAVETGRLLSAGEKG